MKSQSSLIPIPFFSDFLDEMFQAMKEKNVSLPGSVLKVNMVLAGKRQGVEERANGLNRYIRDYGVTIRYTDPDALN